MRPIPLKPRLVRQLTVSSESQLMYSVRWSPVESDLMNPMKGEEPTDSHSDGNSQMTIRTLWTMDSIVEFEIEESGKA